MTAKHADALFKGRFGREFAGGQVLERMLENPWIVKRPSANAHTRAAGLVEHHLGGLRRGNIAIADDGNLLYGLNHGADAVEFYLTGETLLARAAVNENCRDASVFQCAGEIGRGEIF